MIDIRRGATPTFEFETETDLSVFSEIYIVIKQEVGNGYVSVEKTLTKDCKKLDEKHFSVKLSQEETLAFEDGKKTELQLKGKTHEGDVMTTDIFNLNVKRVLKEEVI